MSNLYRGKQPCAGCGKTGEVNPRISKDCLCFDCQRDLKLGREVAKFYGVEHSTVTLKELSRVEMQWYKIPYIQTALQKFLESVSEFSLDYVKRYANVPADNFLVGEPGSGTGSTKFVIPTKSIEAAKELCKAFEDKMWEVKRKEEGLRAEMKEELAKERDKIYNEGVRKGRNLLAQLNSGEITLNDLFKEQKYNGE